MKLKEIFKYVGTAAVSAALTVGTMKSFSSKLESSIDRFDANDDGIQDVLVFDAEKNDYFAFLGKKDGNFEKAKVFTQDGIPFYETEDGTYSPWGNYFPKD